MKILVFGDRLEVGGSQVNAIELSARLAAIPGNRVVYYATPGPMIGLVRSKGLRYVPAPHAHRHPSPDRMRALGQLVRDERPDVVHAWDWWQCLDAYWSVHLALGIPLLVTDMNMTIFRVLPRSVHTTFGTPELADLARSMGRTHVGVLVPPVDTRFNAPGVADGAAFRSAHCIARADTLLVTVSRFAANLKAESLRRTIDAMASIGADQRVRLALVGDGTIRTELEARAAAVDDRLGRRAVVFTGALLDPRPAYAAADVFVGMGGSALRAMAFGSRVVVVGERGYSECFNEHTAATFLYRGLYGLGDDAAEAQPTEQLATQIRSLLEHPAPAALSGLAREFVVSNFSLETGTETLLRCLQQAVAQPPGARARVVDAVRTSAVLAGGFVRQCRLWPPSLPAPRLPQDPASLAALEDGASPDTH